MSIMMFRPRDLRQVSKSNKYDEPIMIIDPYDYSFKPIGSVFVSSSKRSRVVPSKPFESRDGYVR